MYMCTGKDREFYEIYEKKLGQEDPLPLIGSGPMMSPCELLATKLPRYLLASSFKARAVQSDVATRIFFSLCLVDNPKENPIIQAMRPTRQVFGTKITTRK